MVGAARDLALLRFELGTPLLEHRFELLEAHLLALAPPLVLCLVALHRFLQPKDR